MTRSDSPTAWQQAHTARIGAAVKALRRERGLSGDALVSALAARGVEFSRNVLASLETGRRPYVTVSELLALAQVLDTAPAALMFPDPEADVRLLPDGGELPGSAVIDWLSGTATDVPSPLLSEPNEDAERRYRRACAPLRAAREHRRLLFELLYADVAAAGVDASTTEDARFDEAVRRLAEHRANMADEGWTLPELPDDGLGVLDVAHVLDLHTRRATSRSGQ